MVAKVVLTRVRHRAERLPNTTVVAAARQIEGPQGRELDATGEVLPFRYVNLEVVDGMEHVLVARPPDSHSLTTASLLARQRIPNITMKPGFDKSLNLKPSLNRTRALSGPVRYDYTSAYVGLAEADQLRKTRTTQPKIRQLEKRASIVGPSSLFDLATVAVDQKQDFTKRGWSKNEEHPKIRQYMHTDL